MQNVDGQHEIHDAPRRECNVTIQTEQGGGGNLFCPFRAFPKLTQAFELLIVISSCSALNGT